jgi:DNA-binding GntR family transcriptional regulator
MSRNEQQDVDPVSSNGAVHPPLVELPPGAGSDVPGRALLKDRAYAEIKQRILQGDFAPNSFLSERHVASQLAMSKTPVRAAFERLELEGLVTISPQQGIIVRDLSIHEIGELYELRAALEGYLVRTLAGRLTPAQILRLEANLETQKVNCTSCDVLRCVALDAEFHVLFCEFFGNGEIHRIIAQLREKIHRVIARVFRLNPTRATTSYLEHLGIAEAVIQGDAALATQRLEEHLEFGKRCLLSPRGDGTA